MPRLIPDRVRPLIDWLGGFDLSLLVSLLILVVAVLTFIAVADAVTEGELGGFDRAAIRALRRADDPAKPIGPFWLPEAARDVTGLGSASLLTLFTLVVAGFLWLNRDHGAMWLVLASAAGGYLIGPVVKAIYARPRPDVVPHLMIVGSYSFPSGHSIQAACVYLTLGALLARIVERRWLKAYFLSTAVLLTALVGLSRVYLGVHYPTDVLAGWAAGLAFASAISIVAGVLQRRGKVEGQVDVTGPRADEPVSPTPSKAG